MQGTVLPALGVGATARTAQWLGAALLITPQTILLGMTFPIMSAAWLRTETNSDSEVLGGL